MVLYRCLQKFFAGKETSEKWDAYKCVIVRVQSIRVLVEVKDKAERKNELWMMRETEAMDRKEDGGMG